MKIDFDLIDYPLKIKDNVFPICIKLKKQYEFRILDTIDSKRIFATKKKHNSVFLHLQIGDNTCKIVGYTYKLFVFNIPCDFYVDSSESLGFYSALGHDILNGSLNELLSSSQNLFCFLQEHDLPKYSPSLIEYAENGLHMSIKKNFYVKKNELKAIKILYDDDIPNSCPENYKNKVKEWIGEETYIVVEQFIETLPHPILRVGNIYKLYKDFKKSTGVMIKYDYLKKSLPIYRFFYRNGPWRKSWVKYGYNPLDNNDNYRYQIIDSRNEGKFYHLFENEQIIKEVDLHKEWYLNDKSNIKDGFFKKTLSQMISYQMYLNLQDEEENSEIVFDTFDI